MSDIKDLLQDFDRYVKENTFVNTYREWKNGNFDKIVNSNTLDKISEYENGLNSRIDREIEKHRTTEQATAEYHRVAADKFASMKRLRIQKNKLPEKRHNLIDKLKTLDKEINDAYESLNKSGENNIVEDNQGLEIKYKVAEVQKIVHQIENIDNFLGEFIEDYEAFLETFTNTTHEVKQRAPTGSSEVTKVAQEEINDILSLITPHK